MCGTVCVHFMINNSPKKYKLFVVFVLRFQMNFTLTVFERSDPLPTKKKKVFIRLNHSQYRYIYVQLRLFYNLFFLFSVLALKVQSKCNKVI